MIKIDKDLAQAPATLNSKLTKQRRQEVIDNQGYIYDAKYDSRYKMADIKTALRAIYHHKCAFCEQKVERFDVEHFRPKSVYYWLAYSWDNLLLACPTCNGFKNNHFEILGQVAVFQANDIAHIHRLNERYDGEENSRFFNPELEDPVPHLVFSKKGKISSNHAKVAYTIRLCKLDRPHLNDERKDIYKDFRDKLEDLFFQKRNRTKNVMPIIKRLIEDFKKDAQNPKNEFLAFRQYVSQHFSPF